MKSIKFLAVFATATIFSLAIFQCRDEDARAIKSAPDAGSKISALADPDAGTTCAKGPVVSAAQELGLKSVLIVLESSNLASFENVASEVQEAGGRITVKMASIGLFALIPPEKENVLSALPEVKIISSGPVAPERAKGLSGAQKTMVDVWNRSLTNTRERDSDKPHKPLVNDMRRRPPFNPAGIENRAPVEIPGQLGQGSPFSSHGESPQIEYASITAMSNTVAVAVFFPESNGVIDPNKENWTQTQIDNTLAEVAASFNWWATKAPIAQKLSFEIALTYTPFNSTCVMTSYESINRPSTEEDKWIGQIMTCLSYTGTYDVQVDSFNTWLKGKAKSKQAYSIFVVNDTLVSNHTFLDGYFAYAYLGGPFMVMTYNNDGYGIENMDAVCAHENAHIFNAYDEYYQPGYQTCDCAESQLGCANENCEHNCRQSVCCIQRGDVMPYLNECICDCTKGQIGWSCGNCGSQTCTFTVTAPASGQTLYTQSSANIAWTTNGDACAPKVSIYYSPNGGTSGTVIAESVSNTGSHSWTTPNTPTTNGMIIVTDGGAVGKSGKFAISTCGNGRCDSSESPWNCPTECPGFCGDGFCNVNFAEDCPEDCGGGSESNPSRGCGVWIGVGYPGFNELGVNLIILVLPLAILLYLKKKTRKK